MKKHHVLSFLKGAAFAALSCVCLTLTSCGGGGNEEMTPEAQAAKHFEGKTLVLQSATAPACTVELRERINGTGIVEAFICYGNGPLHEGQITIISPVLSGEKVVSTGIQISTVDGSCTEERDFKLWWGESDEDGNLAISGDAPIDVQFTTFTNTMETGTYTCSIVPEGAEEPRNLGGSVKLYR